LASFDVSFTRISELRVFALKLKDFVPSVIVFDLRPPFDVRVFWRTVSLSLP
jgi:hypothetical protein